MRILVTGCGGFLGSEIVRQLLQRGDQVIGVARGEYPELVSRGMQPVRGDLSDRAFVLRELARVDAVVHTAAVAGVWGPPEYFHRINTEATQHVIEACQKSQIEALVFSSSPSVTFTGQHQRGVDESEPYARRWLCHYPRTKALAEQAVLRADRSGPLRTLALRPHLIWGHDDPHILPRMLQRAGSGRLRVVGEGQNQVDTVHVINAAAAHLDAVDALANDSDRAGGRPYFITQDEPVNCWDWISQICELGGVPPPHKRISFRAAYALGACLEAGYWLAGKTTEPPMTRFVAAQLARDHYFDISAARDRLGYRPRISMADGLEQLAKAWA